MIKALASIAENAGKLDKGNIENQTRFVFVCFTMEPSGMDENRQ